MLKFHTQIVLVYLSSDFGAIYSSRKNSLKPPILGVQGRSRSSMLVPLESPSAVLVMTSSNSVSICNRSHARRVNNAKITIS